MSESDPRIEMLIQGLKDSDIDPSERDALTDDLLFAQQINGSPDPVQQGIKRLTISGVRREMLAHARMKAHIAACAIRMTLMDPGKVPPSNVWPQVWQFVNANGRTLIGWIGVVLVVIVLKGELKTLLSHIPTRGTSTAIPYPTQQLGG
jgi:hypothetical protein